MLIGNMLMVLLVKEVKETLWKTFLRENSQTLCKFKEEGVTWNT